MRYYIYAVLLLLGCLFLLGGCTSKSVTTSSALEGATTDQPISEYRIQPADRLDIKFFYNQELNESVVVRPDGKISLQLLDDIHVAGLQPMELDDLLTKRYSEELRDPAVTVILRSSEGQKVYIGGEVNRQGLVTLTSNMTPLQAVISAGGLKESAAPDEALIIRKSTNKTPFPISVDLSSEIYGSEQTNQYYLQPFDIVYVPKSAIAKANKFVHEYVEQLLLFRGVNFGFTYELSDNN